MRNKLLFLLLSCSFVLFSFAKVEGEQPQSKQTTSKSPVNCAALYEKLKALELKRKNCLSVCTSGDCDRQKLLTMKLIFCLPNYEGDMEKLCSDIVGECALYRMSGECQEWCNTIYNECDALKSFLATCCARK